MPEQKRFNTDAPEAVLKTFFSGLDRRSSLLELVIWNGKFGFKFKKLGRTATGEYDKESSKEIRIFLNNTDLISLSKTLTEICTDRTTRYASNQEYVEVEENFEVLNEYYDSVTGDKKIKNSLIIKTVSDANGIPRIAIVGENSSARIEIVLVGDINGFTVKIPKNIIIDRTEGSLLELSTFLDKQITSSQAETAYNIQVAVARWTSNKIISSVYKALGKEFNAYPDNNGNANKDSSFSMSSFEGDDETPF